MTIYTGTAGNDTFTTANDINVAAGGAGDDVLSGNGVLIGGAGADTLTAGNSTDWLFSADAPSDFDQIYYDSYLGIHLPQLLDTGIEVDNLIGGPGQNRLFAGYGDNVDGSAGGGDYLYISFMGAPSGVTVDFSLSSQTIGGGVIKGIELIPYVQGSRFDDSIKLLAMRPLEYGLEASTLVGGEGNDTLSGDNASDILDGGPGNDVLDGGLNIDTVTYAFATSGVNVSLALQGHAQDTGAGGVDTLYGVECIVGSSYNDTLGGDGGDNTLYGGGGVDTVTFAAATGGVQVHPSAYVQGFAHGAAGNDTLVDIENAVGSAFNDEFYGDVGAGSAPGNSFDGGAGDDTFYNGSGVDTFTGGAGADHFVFDYIFNAHPPAPTLITDFEVGRDVIVPNELNQLGYEGSDPIADGYVSFASDGAGGTLIFADRDGPGPLAPTAIVDLAHVATAGLTWSLLVGSSVNASAGGGSSGGSSSGGGGGGSGGGSSGGGGTYTPIVETVTDGASVQGGAGADTLTGSGARDTMFGGDGGDVIVGGEGFNQVNGNKGDDIITGKSLVGDWLLGGQGNDLISAATSVGKNILNGNLGDDVVVGGSGGDFLRGGQGNDAITGGSGADWISGDRGNDILTGGRGADIFHTAKGAGSDIVVDFTAAEGDRVQVDPGTAYTVSQMGADTLIDMGDGDQLILRNVQRTALPEGWLFGA